MPHGRYLVSRVVDREDEQTAHREGHYPPRRGARVRSQRSENEREHDAPGSPPVIPDDELPNTEERLRHAPVPPVGLR